MTTVVSVRGKTPADFAGDPDFMYVGRAVPRRGWAASPWGNPFHEGMDPFAACRVFDAILETDCRRDSHLTIDGIFTIQDAVEWYEQYVKARRSLWTRLPELSGRTLGCWCGCWEPGESEIPCHAIVLARLVDSLALAASPVDP